MPVRLIVGLGNPGDAYYRTRHNIGFRVIDAWALRRRCRWKASQRFQSEVASCDHGGGDKIHLLKPMTFMNRSGDAVSAAARYFDIDPSDVLVVFDEYQIDTGRCKLSLSGSAGGHNGVADLLAKLGDGFMRLRIGVGAPKPEAMSLADFVLGRFNAAEETLLQQRLPEFLDGLDLVVDSGPVLAMNHINNRHKSTNECKHSESL